MSGEAQQIRDLSNRLRKAEERIKNLEREGAANRQRISVLQQQLDRARHPPTLSDGIDTKGGLRSRYDHPTTPLIAEKEEQR